jgi:hypothetical protein
MTDTADQLRKQIEAARHDRGTAWATEIDPDDVLQLCDDVDRLKAAQAWQPIDTVPKGSKVMQWLLLCHETKRWIRMGWYYAACDRWYYSGTTEQAQHGAQPDDAPTHWMPLQAFPDGYRLSGT